MMAPPSLEHSIRRAMRRLRDAPSPPARVDAQSALDDLLDARLALGWDELPVQSCPHCGEPLTVLNEAGVTLVLEGLPAYSWQDDTSTQGETT